MGGSVNDFSGLTPLGWGADTMRANGFSDTDGLLAIDTDNEPLVSTAGRDGRRDQRDSRRR